MPMVTDFHSHILPGVDDGSASVEESIAMLRAMAQQGIEHVVATPHFYPQYQTPEAFLRKREAAEQQLRREMENYTDLPRLTMGAEVYFFHGISQTNCLKELTIGKKDCILLEMPESAWSESMFREIELIHSQQGITPIIAHVDRYLPYFRKARILQRLDAMPVLVQANAGFFLNRATAGKALRMLRKGQIHILGSDCHNLTSRPPNLADALSSIQKRLGDDAVGHLLAHEACVL